MLSFGAKSFVFQFKNIKIKIYRTIILPVVLNGYENWLLTLSWEHRLKTSENRVVRRIFGPKRDEVTGEWRQLYNELNDLSSSPSIIWVIKSRRMNGWACRMNGGEERCIHGFDWDTRERAQLEDPGRDGRIKLNGSSGTGMGGAWTGLIWLKIGTGSGPLKMQ